MKKLGIAFLAAAIELAAFKPKANAASTVEAGACIFVVLTVTVSGVAVLIRCCQPSYRCTSDPDTPGTNWCSTMTRRVAEASGLVQAGPNYRTYAGCMSICATNTSSSSKPQEADPQLVVEKSTDLQTWTACGVMETAWNGEIEWQDPAPPVRQCFYRIRRVEVPTQKANKL